MSTIIKAKRSSVQGKVPLTTDLELGEFAINTYDGKLYTKKNVNGTESIVDLSLGTTNLTYSANSSTVTVLSDTGTDAIIPAANSTSAGVLTAEAQTIAGAKTFTGDIVFDATGGNEGGEIKLAASPIGGTLAGSVSIDIYQNRLRIFENGGSNRGVYMDLTTAASSVGTNLLSGSATNISTSANGSTVTVVSDTGSDGVILAANSTTAGVITAEAQTIGGAKTFTGNVTADKVIASNNGNGTNFQIGDDVWIGDINTANTLRITGQQDATQGYIVFGNSNTTALGRTGTGSLTYGGSAVILASDTDSASTASKIVIRDASRNFSANTITAALSGNATTATTLQTARTIAISGDVTGTATSFNGSANITISADITANTIVNADINTAAAIADTKLATISTAGKVLNSATTATNLNTASAIVARDASGNFSANIITAALSGNASTATTLAATRTLWGQNFNGSANVTGSLTSVGDITGTGAVTITATAGTLNLAATGTNAITATTNGVERLRINPLGYIGSRVTPSAWNPDTTTGVIDMAAGSLLSEGNNFISIAQNFYNDTNNDWVYKNNGYASRYIQASGEHAWAIATSGLAGNLVDLVPKLRLTSDYLTAYVPLSVPNVEGAIGNALNPAFTNSSEMTGMFFPVYNTVGFTADGTETMRITSTGNVGIGTASPQTRIAINTPSALSSVPAIGTTGGSLSVTIDGEFGPPDNGLIGGLVGASFFLQSQDINGGSNAYNILLNPNGGNIGIGTTDPASKLTVSDGGGGGVEFGPISFAVTTTYYNRSTSAQIVNSQIASEHYFTTGASERMRISANGNVGIATTAPAEKLDVSGNIKLSGGISANNSFGSAGQVLTSNSTGVYWSTATAVAAISDTAPSSPTNGQMWFDSSDGTFNIYYNDGTSSQWVSAVANQNDPAFRIKTSNYTASNRDNIIADTSGGSFTITLPPSPIAGQYITIYDNAGWATNNLTIARNGSTIENLAEDFILDVSSIKVEFIYNGSTWQVYSSVAQTGSGVAAASIDEVAAIAIALG